MPQTSPMKWNLINILMILSLMNIIIKTTSTLKNLTSKSKTIFKKKPLTWAY